MSPQGAPPKPLRAPWRLQNSHFSIKNQLNIEVTFACHFEPLKEPTWLQLGPNLASKMPLKRLKNYVKTQLAQKSIFSTPLKRNASFCLPKGVTKSLKRHSKTTSYRNVVSTSKKHPPRTDLGPSWPGFEPSRDDFGPAEGAKNVDFP